MKDRCVFEIVQCSSDVDVDRWLWRALCQTCLDCSAAMSLTEASSWIRSHWKTPYKTPYNTRSV